MTQKKSNHWLKLKVDFFSTLAMKKIRKIAGGDTYIVIYQKMMLLTVSNEGHYTYQGLEQSLPEELALLLDEESDNVEVVLNLLKSLKLIEYPTKDTLYLNQVPVLTGKNDDSTARVREYRERQKIIEKQSLIPQIDSVVTECNALQIVTVTECNDHVTECNAPREEKNREELEKNKEKEDKNFSRSNDQLKDIYNFFNEINGTKNNDNKKITAGLQKILKEHSFETICLVIEYMAKGDTYEWFRSTGQNTLSKLAEHTKFYEKLEKAQLWQKNKPIEGVIVRFTAENTCQIWSRVDNEWFGIHMTPEQALEAGYHVQSDFRGSK